MNNNNNEPINTKSLLTSVLSLIIGVLLCFNSDMIFELIGYTISAILILYGFVRIFMGIREKKRTSAYNVHYASGILLLSLGCLISIFPKAIPVTLSIAVGALIILNGIKRLILGIAIRKIDGQGSKLFSLVSVFMILLGLIIITQAFLPLLGIFIIIYSISDLAGYVYYKSQNKDYSEVFNKEIPKDIKEKESVDAVIDE